MQSNTQALSSQRFILGCWRLNKWQLSRQELNQFIQQVQELGIDTFDHADIYGDTACESIFGKALKLHPDWRDKMVIATKCGIRFEDEPLPGQPHRYDFSFEHIVQSAEESLNRLQIDTIDLLMLHRPDFLADPEEIARAFTQLRESGKVREFGVSNFRPSLCITGQSSRDSFGAPGQLYRRNTRSMS